MVRLRIQDFPELLRWSYAGALGHQYLPYDPYPIHHPWDWHIGRSVRVVDLGFLLGWQSATHIHTFIVSEYRNIQKPLQSFPNPWLGSHTCCTPVPSLI